MTGTIGSRIKLARQRRKLSQEALAAAIASARGAPLSRGAISLWEIDYTRPEADTLSAVAEILGVSVDWIIRGQTDEPLPKDSLAIATGSSDGGFTRKRIPLYGSPSHDAAGGAVMKGEPIGTVPCPPTLESIDGVYAMLVPDDSMAPRYLAGEIVFVAPGRPVRKGNYVAIVRKDEQGNKLGVIREFVTRTPSTVAVRTLNPVEDQEFPVDDVIAVHKIVLAGEPI